MNAINENELVAAFAQGDERAFEQVYNIFYHPILFFTRNMVREEDALDITADTFVKLWKRRHAFDSLINIRAFLYITARNACLDYLRWKKKTLEKHEHLASLTEQEEHFFSRLEVESELMRWVVQEAEKLPPREAQVFTLAFINGYKNEEIAATLQLSDQIVRNLKARAVKKIKLALFHKNIQPAIALLMAITVSILG